MNKDLITVTYNGERYTFQALSKLTGIAEQTLRTRHSKGYVEHNLVKPPAERRTKRKCPLLPTLTKTQVEVIHGSLLGDGSLTKPSSNKSYYVENHCLRQSNYLNWKYLALQPYSCNISERNNQIEYRSFSTNYFAEMERLWYLRGGDGNYLLANNRRVKIVPHIELAPLTVTIWFLDDGYNNVKSRTVDLATVAFSLADCEFLSNELKRLGITKVSVSKQRRVTVHTSSYLDFISLVKEEMDKFSIPLRYKIDLSKYVAPKWHADWREETMYIRKRKNRYNVEFRYNGKTKYAVSYKTFDEACEGRDKAFKNLGLVPMYENQRWQRKF